MAIAMWAGFGQQWELNHKVDFDGNAKKIYVAKDVPVLDVKQDLYSAWKQWVQLYDYAKYLPAIRSIGGDPVGLGQYAGDIYFLMNDWQVVVNHPLQVTGTLYHDNPSLSPFIIEAGGGVTATVSSLVQSLGFEGTINNNVVVEPNILPEDVWNYLLINANTPGSVGERFKSLLTVAKYLGLK